MSNKFNRKEYWQWLDRIWQKPEDITQRLVFADWLDEQGCNKAAKKQRLNAQIIQDCQVLFSAQVSQNKPTATRFWWNKEVFGYIERKGYCQSFKIKRDGNIIFDKYLMHRGMGQKKHILKGKPKYKTFSKLKKDSEKRLKYQWSKNVNFAKLYGTQAENRTLRNPCKEIVVEYITPETEEQILINLKNKEQNSKEGWAKTLEELLKNCYPEKDWSDDLFESIKKCGVFPSLDITTIRGKGEPILFKHQEDIIKQAGKLDSIKDSKIYENKTAISESSESDKNNV